MHKASYLVIVRIRLVRLDMVLINVNWRLLFSYYPLDAYKLLGYLFKYFCDNVTSANSVHLLPFPESFKDKKMYVLFKKTISKVPEKNLEFSFYKSQPAILQKTYKPRKICFIGVKNFCKVYLCIVVERDDRYLCRLVVQTLLYQQNCNSVTVALSIPQLFKAAQ